MMTRLHSSPAWARGPSWAASPAKLLPSENSTNKPTGQTSGSSISVIRHFSLILGIAGILFVSGCGADKSPDETTPPKESPTAEADRTTDQTDPGIDMPASEPAASTENDATDAPADSEFSLPPSGDMPAKDPAPADDPVPSGGGIELPELNGPQNATGSTESTSSTGELNLQITPWEEIQKAVTSTGKITVVDLWSTACDPCLKEFPGLVRLNQEHGEEVSCFAVSLDFDGRKTAPPESYQEAITEFLTKNKATFPNYICATDSDSMYDALDIPSIPVVMIYDADGKLIKKFVDAGDTAGFGYEKDVIPFVQSLL